MTPNQVEALLSLMHKSKMKRDTIGALEEYFLGDQQSSQKALAEKYGIKASRFNEQIRTGRRYIEAAYTIVTGIKPEKPLIRQRKKKS